jgi:integrase
MRTNRTRAYGPYPHGDQWRVHYVSRRADGTRKTEYTTHSTRASADLELAGARDEAQGTTVKQATDALIAKMKLDERAESTITTAEFRLAHFFNLDKNGERPIRWLNRRGEELYAKARENRSADTHQAELDLAKRVGDICVEKRWLRANPFALVKPVGKKTHGSSKPRLRVDESRKLMAHCLERSDDQHCVLTLAYLLLGSRASELVKRDVRDLDDGGSLLWIDRTKTAAGSRKLRIPDELRVPLLAMAEGRKPDAPIFTREDGTKADRHWAYRHVKRICGEAKVPALSPQALRRTQSDMATDAGETGIAVARHLGHASSTVTDRSYRSREVVNDAKQERAFRVIAGGKR